MAERPVFHPALGAYFVRLREAKGWGQRQAAKLAEGKKLSEINHQVLLRLEHGLVRKPDASVLRQVSALYGEPYEQVARRWFQEEYGVGVEPTKEEIAAALTRNKDRELHDDDELEWVGKWRALTPSGRKLAAKQVDALVEEFGSEAIHPPSRQAKRRSAS